MAQPGAVAARFGLEREAVAELLMDFESYGWVRKTQFAGTGGWSLTEAGRAANERHLAAELVTSGASEVVSQVHAGFVPLNARFQEAVTRWQVRPVRGDAMARNDHTDFRWDDHVMDTLESLGRQVAALCVELDRVLSRFHGYAQRYVAAMTRVNRGERRWVDGVGIDSCHAVWFELHEDLLATLGLERGRGV